MKRKTPSIQTSLSSLAALAILPLTVFAAENLSVGQLAETGAPHPQRDTKISGSTSMRSALIDEDYKQSRSVGMGVSLNVDHRIEESLSARLSLGLNLDTGSSQATFSDEYRPNQGIALLDAYLNWKPAAGFDLRGGAINQGWMASPLLVGNVAFPAVMASWKHEADVFFFQLSAEQAIPTSDTTHSMPRGKDKLPTADFERITVGAQFTKDSSVQAHVGHFAFNNLTSGIALESRYRGNSVTGVGDEGSSFVYDYSGIETGARAEGQLSERLSGAIDASWLTNLRAPLSRSRAMRVLGETPYRLTPKMTLTPSLQLFRSESDASPAYYNIATLAHSNREGLGAGIKLAFPASQLDIEGSWVRARVIERNPFQSDFSGIVFGLRKSYDLL